jgi:LysM repeat protein
MKKNVMKTAGTVVVVGLFLMTQGCITTESFGSGRGAGAKHKGPWRHQHQGGVQSSGMQTMQPVINDQMVFSEEVYEPIITSSEMGADISPVEIVPAAATEIYLVQKGDMISQLAIDFDTSSARLIEMNNLENPDVLYVGQKLKVPAGRGAISSAKTIPLSTSSAVEKGGTYLIQSGDTLSEIAQRASVSVDDLRSLNQINNDTIYAGQKIYIPSYGRVPDPAVLSDVLPLSEPAPLMAPEPAVASPVEEAIPVEIPEGAIGMVKEVQVYPGETLDDYARIYSVSKAEILRANPQLEGEEPKSGFTIRIPISE